MVRSYRGETFPPVTLGHIRGQAIMFSPDQDAPTEGPVERAIIGPRCANTVK
jgi:hypothetical protein